MARECERGAGAGKIATFLVFLHFAGHVVEEDAYRCIARSGCPIRLVGLSSDVRLCL